MSCSVFQEMEAARQARPAVQVATNVLDVRPSLLRDFKETSPLAVAPRFTECATKSLAGLGAPWYVGTFCASFSAKIDELGLLLASAEKAGATKGVAYQQAKARWDKEMSLFAFNRSDPALPSTCAQVTSEIQLLIKALTPAVAAAGGEVPVPTAVPPPSSPLDLFDSVKTVAIAGAVIAGVVLVAPIVWELVAAKRALRRTSMGGLAGWKRGRRRGKKR